MTRIWMVRHGRTGWTGRRFCGRADPPLSDEGIAEADEAAERLAGAGLAGIGIVASPMRRAAETAERLRLRLGGLVATDPRLREIDFGDAEGLTFEEVAERWPDLSARVFGGDRELDWPGGETTASLRERARAAADDLRDQGRDLVVVAHGFTIRELVLAFDPAGLAGPDSPLPTGGVRCVEVPAATSAPAASASAATSAPAASASAVASVSAVASASTAPALTRSTVSSDPGDP